MMRARAVAAAALLAVAVAGVAACDETSSPPASFLAGLRVIAIVAEPPEIAVGETSVVTITAVDTTGATPTVSWQRCLLAPLPGQVVSPDCVTVTSAPYLEPIGDGTTISVTMPELGAALAAAVDSTGGAYLPLVARVTSSGQSLVATYRLRLAVGAAAAQPRNANPEITAVVTVAAGADGGVATPIDEAVPPVVHAGDLLSLEALFSAASAQMYTVVRGPAGTPPTTVTEVLTTSWFTTAGELSNERTSDEKPLTILDLTRRLPTAPARIDIYAVGRDERGGTDLAHRVLQLE